MEKSRGLCLVILYHEKLVPDCHRTLTTTVHYYFFHFTKLYFIINYTDFRETYDTGLITKIICPCLIL